MVLKYMCLWLSKLGASINADSPDTQILPDLDGPSIEVIHDMVHNMKNVRNSWSKIEALKNGNGDTIDWNFIVKLQKLQESEKLRAANKLTSKHINFENFKMKAYLALQVFSRSVAKSLKSQLYITCFLQIEKQNTVNSKGF